MNPEEIKRFNVYAEINPNRKPTYYLEALFHGSYWESVTWGKNILNYDSLDLVAKRIVELAPKDNRYKRVVFSDKAEDKSSGKLEGIDLNDGKPRLTDSLSREEKLDLLSRIDKYFNEKNK